MKKNEFGRLEMYPLPDVGQGKLFIIGEYPNIQELRQGRYFLSSGADALNSTLQRCGIDVKDCCYSVAVPYLMNKKNKTIPVDRLKKERARLFEEIKSSGAKVVMPLGALASSVLLQQKVTMKKVLGNVMDIPELEGITIIPNYHPALLLHNPGQYKTFQRVISTVAQAILGNNIGPGTTQWKWLQENEIDDFIEQVNKLPFVACDLETSSLSTWKAEIWVAGVAIAKNQVVVIPNELVYKYPDKFNILLDQKCRWVWHNGQYDISVLWWSGFDKARLDEDTILQHYTTNETSGTHNLGILATVFLGADEYKSKMNSEFANITDQKSYLQWKEALGERVAVDADYTFQLHEILNKEIDANADYHKLYNNLLLKASTFLAKVQKRGVHIDREYLEQRVPVYEQRIEELVKEIQEAAAPFWNPDKYKEKTGAKTAGELFKPTSVKQLKWLMYDVLHVKPTIRTKQGTGVEVIESIENPPEFLKLILQLRSVKKEYSTYVKNYLTMSDAEDNLHCTFKLHSTATGRLSCSEPNLQNVPSGKPDIRRALIPRTKQRIFMEVDYSGAELRVLAHVSGDSALAKALTEGDPHGELAAKIFGTAYTEAPEAEAHALRGRAKTVNFGVAYGRQAPSISEAFGISLEEAQTYIDAWAEMYPDAWAYLQSCERDVLNGVPLVTLYGRYRRFGLITRMNAEDLINEAKNFRIQSISSDNLLTAAMQVDELLETEYDAYIVNLIHDSVLIDCPANPETVQKVSQIMSQAMVDVPKSYGCKVPFKTDTDLGPDWGHVIAYDNSNGTVETEEFDEEGKPRKVDVPYEEYVTQFGIRW